ncbi:hypothetical protein CNECB9_980015 [Cupriavidus necator]|uniref:Uncharacterized protein n=1 Tax=Cupriavidus necator TaxID=106590 RepID=A0A1K0ISS0_CUPNE|nr:hypothetical protein CNECB9_980015 [Cupriavidus necator]
MPLQSAPAVTAGLACGAVLRVPA